MITSTITRPTSIATTSSCEQKLSLVETVDIALMRPPKPRIISLEPISKRARMRRSVKNKERSLPEGSEAGPRSDRTTGSISPLPDESASQCESEPNVNPQISAPSDALSTISTPTRSTGSSTTQSVRQDTASSSAKSAKESQRGSSSSKDDKTITATIELLKSGCLPGDNLPLKISIKHTKGIKSLHGIIITLYRQGRIDSSPSLSRFMDTKGKDAEELKHEEYYPKSRTGLSGLSLSAAGSSSMFRKDLAQIFAPLIIDPTSLTAVVHASVRVPEDAFPTISNVPGEMISFKYCVEVVVDLGGKLAGQQRHLPRVGAVAVSSSGGCSGARADRNPNTLAAWNGSIIDTDHIRREKSVAACLFEVVVGSMDSSRRRRPEGAAQRRSNDWPEAGVTPMTRDDLIHEEMLGPRDVDGQQIKEEPYSHPYEEFHNESSYPGDYPHEGYDNQHYDEQYHGFYPPAHAEIPVPPPELQDEGGISEKERIRRAEERLLPSQPPQGSEASSSSGPIPSAPGPSAPPDEQEEDLYGSEDVMPCATAAPGPSLQYDGSSRVPFTPSAPALEDLVPGAHASDDKQELQRQRMLAEASAPPEFEGADGDARERSAGGEHEPSAPTLTEEDEYGGPSYQESLPKYER